MANPAQRRGDCMWFLLQVNCSKIVLNIWVMTQMALFTRKVNVPLISGAQLPQKAETRLFWHDARADLHNFTTISQLFRLVDVVDFWFHVTLLYLTLQGLGLCRLHSYITGKKLYWLFRWCPPKLEKRTMRWTVWRGSSTSSVRTCWRKSAADLFGCVAKTLWRALQLSSALHNPNEDGAVLSRSEQSRLNNRISFTWYRSNFNLTNQIWIWRDL